MSWSLSLDDVAKATSGTVISKVSPVVTGLGSDTRQDLSGQLFVALKGDAFDAHDFLKEAVNKGAQALLVHQDEGLSELKGKVSIIKVDDTLVALQSLARWWRVQCGFKVIGITGSNGKTTTKEISKVLLQNQLNTYASRGSFNNHWGVPFSILQASQDVEVLILEMGMNHLGEIKKLCDVAAPDVVVCTMVGQAHIGELGSQENIARAKEEIYLHSSKAQKIFNLDNEHTIAMFERARVRQPDERFFTFSSFRDKVDVTMKASRMSFSGLDVEGQIMGVGGQASVPLIGRHNVVNIMAASCIALACGLEPEQIWRNLSKVKPSWGRNQLVSLSNGSTVLFDGYNANPESMAVLIKNLFEMSVVGKKVAVFGEMGELGSQSDKAHQDLGEMVGNTDFQVVWFIGPHGAAFEAGLRRAKFDKTYFISNTYEETLAHKIGSMLKAEDIAVIKGSRVMKLEQVVRAWDPIDFSQ